jgi:hypothetical protein
LTVEALDKKKPGVYILENTPPPGRGNICQCLLGEKNLKRRRENGGKCKRKRKKGKEKEKRGSKRVK